ncbi:MAG: MBL fold metallo-hydrolase, partial [Bacteroidales bacterium]|nr:MBL fold metallo-hydrolase [Bacteroidales bacterium]
KITDKPILYLVNTHSDGDHINGNRFFPESVTIIAHENCRKEFFHPSRNGSKSMWHNPDLAPFIPSITFKDHLTLYLGKSRFEFWYFGIGHTTGDAVVYFPDEKTAFIGDMIFADRPQLIHAYKGGNSFAYIKTQNKMLKALDASLYCSGHADPVTRKKFLSHISTMEKMQARIAELIKMQKTLDLIKDVFEENASRLVEVMYNEIKELQ